MDIKATDQLSFFVMGGYQSDVKADDYYGAWTGDYAIWGGVTAKVSDNAKVNAQVAYDEADIIAASLNVAYELVPGFVVTPEIDYKDAKGSDDAFGGVIRFQRNF